MADTPLVDPRLAVAVTVGPAAGLGATAMITASNFGGDRGRCAVVLGTALTNGVLLTIAAAAGSFPIQGPVVASVMPGALAVGSFLDPPLRPIVITTHPAPAPVVHLQPVATFDVPAAGQAPQMTGFQLLVANLPIAAQGVSFRFAWAIL
jgi:hypothetical protein